MLSHSDITTRLIIELITLIFKCNEMYLNIEETINIHTKKLFSFMAYNKLFYCRIMVELLEMEKKFSEKIQHLQLERELAES